jgi:predicted nucleotidyltransferase
MTTATINDEVLKHITDTIVEHFHPRRIILFGSRARGEAKPDSDYDVLVEMETAAPFQQRMTDVYRAFGLRQWSMDVLVFTPSEVEEERSKIYSIVKIAEREGKLLYVAG